MTWPLVRAITRTMKTDVAHFLSDLPKIEAAALAGETVEIETPRCTLRMNAAPPPEKEESPPQRYPLGWGALEGQIKIIGDLTQPTTTMAEWGLEE